MKKKSFYDIQYDLLTKREKDSILKQTGILVDTSLEEHLPPGDSVYLLNDKRVILNVAGSVIYMFKDKNDYLYFIKKINTISLKKDESSITINDENFIENRNFYLDNLNKDFSLKHNTWDMEKLKEVDARILNLKADDLIKYGPSLVSLFGEYLIIESNKGSWKYFDDPIYGRVPIILIEGKLISPIQIVNDLIKKKRKGNKISLYKTISEFINYYK